MAPYFRALKLLRPRRVFSAVCLVVQSWQLNRRLRRVQRERPVSLVQYAHLGAVGLFRLRPIPAVARLSSYTPLMKEAYGLRRGLFGGLQHVLEVTALRRMDAIFSPSHLIASTLERETELRVRVIETPYTLDCEQVDEAVYRQHLLGKTYLLFFGTLGVIKGVPVIAEIVCELLTRHPDLYFVFVGKEDSAQRGTPMMQQVWAKAGSTRDRVLYLGQLHHEQLYPVLEHARGVVLPSRIDNFPNTCIEAMAFGRVVIGTRQTSFEQLLVDTVSGLLCERDNPQSLLGAIERLLSLAPEQQAEMGRRAQERVAELRPEKVVLDLLDFYGSVLDATGDRA